MALDADLQLQVGLTREALATLTTERDLTAFDTLAEPLATFEAAVNAARADANLSPEGKMNAIVKARTTVEAAIAAYAQQHDDGLTAAETNALKSVTPPTEPDPLRVQSMLTAIRDMDSTQIASLYSTATDEERFVIEKASEVAGRLPRRTKDGDVAWMPLLDLESPMVLEMRERRLERLAGGTTGAELHDIRRLKTAHRSVAGTAKGLVTEFLRNVTIQVPVR